MDKLFFIDAETDGLYGAFLSAAIVVTDLYCKEIERFYYGVDPAELNVNDPWTRENVVPLLGDYIICRDEEELLEQVWTVWMKYRDTSYAVADVSYPVEARLFEKCVVKELDNRKYLGPFPLLDLSSLLKAKGYDPLEDRNKLLGEERSGMVHNALYDVEQMIRVYKRIML